ncbi:intermembrane phospholipid transport protein YdbH family protein [Oleiharenicola lentus]|nr:YdbH domain-containing protein [Oleiharenicola lentus]
MPKSPRKFRLSVLVVLSVTAVAGIAAARWAALPWALGAALKAGGATEIAFDVARVSPWRMELDDLAFRLDAVRFAAERTTLERAHWWSPSLGRLRVQSARVDVEVDQMTASQPATAKHGSTPTAPPSLPLEGISFDGLVTLRAGGKLEQALVVQFAVQPLATKEWGGTAVVTAPGLNLALAGSYAPVTGRTEFQTTSLQLDVLPWRAWLEHWLPLPAGPWEFAGVVNGDVQGSFQEGALAGRGEFHLRQGRLANPALAVVAEGVEMDVPAVDLAALRATGVAVRAEKLTAGTVAMTDLNAEAASATAEQVEVSALSVRALGGVLHVEPFTHRFSNPAIQAVVRAEAIRAEDVLALTQNLPARATGALSGRLPLRYEGGALQLGTGWLGLAEGQSLEIEFHAEGLLTAGTSPKSANYAVLKQVEDGLLKLKVTELRLEVRPPNAPPNRTAQLRIAGEPVDPRVKAPVTLDLNVNGPIESLLNLGLKGGIKTGTKP